MEYIVNGVLLIGVGATWFMARRSRQKANQSETVARDAKRLLKECEAGKLAVENRYLETQGELYAMQSSRKADRNLPVVIVEPSVEMAALQAQLAEAVDRAEEAESLLSAARINLR